MAERNGKQVPARPPRRPATGAPVEPESPDQALAAARERVAELESELAAARKTISALLDKAERRAERMDQNAQVFEAAARMEQVIDARTREVEEKSAALAAANTELRDLTGNLDQIVRQRTRALAESEAQLRRKMAELERLNEMKAEFISIAAHELRTPMTSIVGYLDLFVEGKFGDMPATMKRPVSSLRRNAHRLKRLVDEMLDVSRIEAGRVSLQRVPSDLAGIAADVVAELQPLAHEKQQELSCQALSRPLVDADPDKIHQVVANLVANAIRYTPTEGTVEIRVDEAPQDRFAGSWARLRVRDDGVGIPKGLLGRIFEPFSHVHDSKYHTSSGPDSAGLGLYIARGLVDLHGGLITVDSEEGQYTEFTVLLPLASGRSPSPSP
jgi:two-component system, NarL family, sensor histidine kinase BarA